MRVVAIMAVAAIAVSTATALASLRPIKLIATEDTNSAEVTIVEPVALRDGVPKPIRAFQFRVATRPSGQSVTADIGLACGGSSTGRTFREWTVRRRTPITAWRMVPGVSTATTCAVGLIVKRAAGSRGRMVATIYGGR